MTGADQRKRDATVTIAERGHVPFAVIAVLLLVVSVATIVMLERRSEPRIDRDAELVMDRTETAAQAEFRAAVLEATHQAGGAPINTTTGSNVDGISSASDQSGAFREYVKLLIYLRAVERIPAADQSVGPDSRSTVALEPVAADPDDGELSPDEAIEKVELEIGSFDDDVEQGTVTATIHDVEFGGHVDGEELPAETRSISVSVGTPVFELNEKMNEYESKLNKGFFESEEDGMPDPTTLDGLGQEMAARQYPIAYMKASWNRFGNKTVTPEDHDFTETIGTDHTEVLTNHAIYSVQEDTFGTRDPDADRAMRPQYLCMSLDFTTTISGVDPEIDMNDVVPSNNTTFSEDLNDHMEQLNETGPDGEMPDNMTIPVNQNVNFREELCNEGGVLNDWIFGDEATGELPEVPPLSELIKDGTDSMGVAEQEIELPVESVAEATYIEYKLESPRDPASYLEGKSSDMKSDIRSAGGDVDHDVSSSLPIEESEEYDGSVHDIRDELYELDIIVDREATAGSVPEPDPPSGDWHRSRSEDEERVTDITVDSVSHTPQPDGKTYDREIHSITADATVDVAVTRGYEKTENNETVTTTVTESDSVDVDATVTIDAAYGFRAGGVYYEAYDDFQVEPDPIATDYGTHENVTFRTGFENALVEVTSASEYSTAETEIATQLESDLGNSDPNALEQTAKDSIGEEHDRVLDSSDVIPDERERISETLDEELEDVHENFTADWKADPLRIKINELADDESPPEKVKEHIKAEYEDEYVDDGPYETPESMAKQQIRKAYFDRLYYWLEQFDGEYSGQMEEFNDKIDDNTEGQVDDLNEVLGYVQGLANADYDPDPADLEGSPVHDDAQYEISGSPTYLTATEVERDHVSAVRASNESIMDTDSDAHHHPMAIQTHNRAPWPGIPALFYMPDKWYITINFWRVDVAGEYARLEVSSTIGDPSDSNRLTYVAEESPVEVELSDGSSVQVGRNEAVDFETGTEVIVVMPGAIVKKGGPIPAVADGDFHSQGTTYCTETWREVGPEANTQSC
ncbi:DUF7286 family protein [Natrinema longum]|uniref:Uncharacterized protein n=1 Tax=Natrinema longum TaxID=370324 RepID=A0A8A2U8W7_9EURY|nr:hypothetical protein [Natrinema longum]MBZ6493600.1 hypothetical protein [Natrinema longum]QSW85056.1 hypothetical protein J0X27_16665 [Natrinema longum]